VAESEYLVSGVARWSDAGITYGFEVEALGAPILVKIVQLGGSLAGKVSCRLLQAFIDFVFAPIQLVEMPTGVAASPCRRLLPTSQIGAGSHVALGATAGCERSSWRALSRKARIRSAMPNTSA
jgi:hypothetical protein